MPLEHLIPSQNSFQLVSAYKQITSSRLGWVDSLRHAAPGNTDRVTLIIAADEVVRLWTTNARTAPYG